MLDGPGHTPSKKFNNEKTQLYNRATYRNESVNI